jgi:hypothetical protein
MFEHVGVGFYDAYFRKCAALLAADGVMLLHSIGRSEGPGITNPWIAKYIFPGGYIPALSEILPAIERAGLLVTDIEVLRLHYADTLKAWRERLLARRAEVAALYDERFVRMWEFYLAASEMSFRDAGMMVFQIQLSKRLDVVPRTRVYIARAEMRLRQAEGRYLPPWRLAGEQPSNQVRVAREALPAGIVSGQYLRGFLGCAAHSMDHLVQSSCGDQQRLILRHSPMVRLLFIVQMSDSSDKRMVALSFRPFDRVSLSFVCGKHVVRVVLHYVILDRAAFGAALWPRFNINVGHISLR